MCLRCRNCLIYLVLSTIANFGFDNGGFNGNNNIGTFTGNGNGNGKLRFYIEIEFRSSIGISAMVAPFFHRELWQQERKCEWFQKYRLLQWQWKWKR